MQEDYVLELEHIRKEYPGVVALKDVTLQLRRGEVLGLIGENGAGKSTLIKCCSGAVIPTSGKIKINGKEFDRMTPQLAAENGIAIIYQEFNNVKELSAAENMFLGHPIRKGITIDRKIINVVPVKQVGPYVATVKLHKEVSAEIPFEVIAENAPVEEAPAQETEAPAAE